MPFFWGRYVTCFYILLTNTITCKGFRAAILSKLKKKYTKSFHLYNIRRGSVLDIILTFLRNNFNVHIVKIYKTVKGGVFTSLPGFWYNGLFEMKGELKICKSHGNEKSDIFESLSYSLGKKSVSWKNIECVY